MTDDSDLNPDRDDATPLQRLDAALSAALRAPPLPASFHERLMAAVLRDSERVLAARREALLDEHREELARLRRQQRGERRDTLVTVAALSFGAGLLASGVLVNLGQWLQQASAGAGSGDLQQAWPGCLLALACATGGVAAWWVRRNRSPEL